MSLTTSKTILMLGINGAGMRGLAWLLANQGKTIIGSDHAYTDDEIENISIPGVTQLVTEKEARNTLNAVDVIIHTDAIATTIPLLQEARGQGKEVLAYHKALGEFAAPYDVIAVTGTHGKSSTTAFIAHILVEAGLDPSVLIGASMKGWSAGHARLGKGKYFIVEADEYREHFLTLHPKHIVITSIDYDHPDYFNSLNDVLAAYNRLIGQQRKEGVLITAEEMVTRFPDISWPASRLIVSKAAVEHTEAPLPGTHMKQNAALAVTLAEHLGIDRNKAQQYLETFPGLSRRFESLGQVGKMEIISDYGHHPTEISATIAAARQKYPDRRLLVVFEAHMFERLHSFYEEFAAALKKADAVIIYPPFVPTGREQTIDLQLVKKLEQNLAAHIPAFLLNQPEELSSILQVRAGEYDIALAFSAGLLDQQLRTITTT